MASAAVSAARTAVHSAVDDDHLGSAGLDRRRRHGDESCAYVAGLADLSEPLQVGNAKVRRDFARITRVYRPAQEAIHIVRFQASIL